MCREKDTRERIRGLRSHYGFTSDQLSRYLGISLTDYQSLEDGDCTIYLSTIRKLSDLYNCSEEYILCETEEYEPMDLSHCFVPLKDLDLKVLGTMNRLGKNLRLLRRLEKRLKIKEDER